MKAVKFRKYPTGHSPPSRAEDYEGLELYLHKKE
jgi:hypothetical protein